MRVIRSSDYRRMPWKNGAGETAEIAIAPATAALDAFDWRISMARVDGDGPFSAFAGVERTIAILDGAGIRLQVAERSAVELTPGSAPYTFPADVATSAALLGGPITDFNVMTRRGRVSHSVRLEGLSAAAPVRISAAGTLVFCVDGRVRASSANAVLSIGPRDSVLFESEDPPVRIAPDPQATVLIVEFASA